MDYSVEIDALAAHGRSTAGSAADASATMRSVRLDGAVAAMPGSLSAAASSHLQERFEHAAESLGESLTRYSLGAQTAADGYRQQEDRATANIASFFGR